MGGRKTYSVKKILGDINGKSPERRALRKAIKEKDPKQIADSTLNLFKASKMPSNFSQILDMFEVVQEIEKKKVSKDKLKEEISNLWADTKKAKKIKDFPELDRILVDSAVKILEEKGDKK